MNNYQAMTAFLKILYQNLGTLHHNIVGHNFFTIHPLLGEWYDEIGEMTDDLIERGIPIGNAEPSIKDAVLMYSNELLPVETKDCEDSIRLAYDGFIMAVEKLTAAKDGAPVDVQNKIDEYIYYLRKEADYKMQHFLGEPTAQPTGIDYDD
jgi:hypothetical protein